MAAGLWRFISSAQAAGSGSSSAKGFWSVVSKGNKKGQYARVLDGSQLQQALHDLVFLAAALTLLCCGWVSRQETCKEAVPCIDAMAHRGSGSSLFTCSAMARACKTSHLLRSFVVLVLCLAGSLLSWGVGACAPQWWRKGSPRRLLGSVAEAELLSHLAVLLQPQEPIRELFRSFPIKPDKDWGTPWLSPDLAVYGALREEEAALFVEYDGYYLHLDKLGLKRDQRKTQALLKYAPTGSRVVRIAHAHRGLELGGKLQEVVVDPWRAMDARSLLVCLRQVACSLLDGCGGELQPWLQESLRRLLCRVPEDSFRAARGFATKADVAGGGALAAKQLQQFCQEGLQLPGDRVDSYFEEAMDESMKCIERPSRNTLQWLISLGLRRAQVAKMVAVCPAVLGCSIGANLKLAVDWLHSLGLSRSQVVKILAGSPQVLGYSIEANLKPTVEWLHSLGLSRPQVVKILAGFPSVLGYSIEANLKPTVEWLHSLGLIRPQVVKILAGFPSVLGYSIEANLKPTVEWLHSLGLSRSQVVKILAGSPQVLGLSIEANLKPTVEWLHSLGLSRPQVVKILAGFPSVLGYSIEANLKPTVEWLHSLGLSRSQVVKILAGSPQVLGLSIEANLKPTVEWLHSLGLIRPQVVKILAGFPSVLGYSIEANLKPTVEWLHSVGLSRPQVVKILAGSPQVLGYSIEANLKPTVEWLHSLGLIRPQVVKILAGFPSVLGYSIEANLKPTVEWLHSFGLNQASVAKVVIGRPTVFGYSIHSNLKPAAEWFQSLGLSRTDVGHLLAKSPLLLGRRIEANLASKARLLGSFLGRQGFLQTLQQNPNILVYSLERLHARLLVLQREKQLENLVLAMRLDNLTFARRFSESLSG